MKQLCVSLATLTGLASSIAPAQEMPDPHQVSIEDISYSGTGCPQGTVVDNISSDGQAFTLAFSNFIVDTSMIKPQIFQLKRCTVDIQLRAPSGWSFGLFSLDYRGYSDLTRGAIGKQEVTLMTQGGTPVPLGALNFVGPLQNDYARHQLVSDEARFWTGCRGKTDNRRIRLITEISVRGLGSMTIDTQDGELQQHYGLSWRRCERANWGRPDQGGGGGRRDDRDGDRDRDRDRGHRPGKGHR